MKEFLPFLLDPLEQCLWKRIPGAADARITLPPKTFAVLTHLVTNAGRLITHQEFLEAVWPNVYVQPEVLKTQILAIREALEDDSKRPRYIETLARRGYRFIAAVSDPLTNPRDAAPRLVGRERPLNELHRSLELVLRQRQRQIIFVTGESGLGKTSLVDEFTRQLRAATPNARIGLGQCVEGYGGAEAYYPMLEALRELCSGERGAEVVRTLTTTAPTWLVQIPALVKPELRASLQRELLGNTRDRMLRELRDLVHQLTIDAPLILVFEDLQWTDPSTLDLISVLARARSPARLLLIGTYRSSDTPTLQHPLRTLKQDLLAHHLCTEIALEPLREPDIERYLASEGAPPPEGLARLIHQHTDGNPLFITAALEHLCQRGLLSRNTGQWQLQVSLNDIGFEVPDSLRDMIEARIERLSAEEQQALKIASVAGTTFVPGAIAEAVGLDPERIEQLCDDLSRRHAILRPALQVPSWVSSGTETAYEFVHAMYREVLYRQQSRGRRATLHRKLATHLQARLSEQPQELASVLAHHFECAGEWVLAIKQLKIVAAAAGWRLSLPVAEQALTRALALTKNLPDAERVIEVEILETRAQLAHHAFPFDARAIAPYETLLESAQRYHLLDVEIRAWLGLLFSHSTLSSTEKFLQVIDRALELSARQAPEQRKRTQIHCLLQRQLANWNVERVAECLKNYDEIQTIGDADSRLEFLSMYSRIFLNCSRYQEALRCVNECYQILANPYDQKLTSHYRNLIGVTPRTLTLWGRWGEALNHLASNASAAERDGQLDLVQLMKLQATVTRFYAMDYEGILELCDPLLQQVRNGGSHRNWSNWYIAAAASLTAVGECDRALDVLQQLRQEMREHPRMFDWASRPPFQGALVDTWLAKGNLVAAQQEGQIFLDAALATSERTWQGLAWEANARIALANSDLERAKECISRAQLSTEGYEVPLASWRIHATAAGICGPHDPERALSHQAAAARIVQMLSASLIDHPRTRAAFLRADEVRAVLSAPAAISLAIEGTAHRSMSD